MPIYYLEKNIITDTRLISFVIVRRYVTETESVGLNGSVYVENLLYTFFIYVQQETGCL